MENKLLAIGIDMNGKQIRMSAGAPNNHMLITGMSGAGKTEGVIGSLINQRYSSGDYIVALNSGSSLDHLSEPLNTVYQKTIIKHDISSGILGDFYGSGTMEDRIDHVLDSLSRAVSLTTRERAAIRDAFTVSFLSGDYRELFSDTWRNLSRSGYAVAESAAEKIRPLCQKGFFRDGEFFDKGPDYIYELDVNCLETTHQFIALEFFLSTVYQWGVAGKFAKHRLWLFVDESQNLRTEPGSAIYLLLNQGRKLGINMILARTNEASHGREASLLKQCCYRAYFRPASNSKHLAKEIDARNEFFTAMRLNNLKRGEFVLCGELLCDGKNQDSNVAWLKSISSKYIMSLETNDAFEENIDRKMNEKKSKDQNSTLFMVKDT